MGDISDMMLDGQMCQWCGGIIDDDKGYPVVCRGCQKHHNVNEFGESKDEIKKANIERNARQKKVRCPHCNKKVKAVGLEMHIKDVHGE